VKGRVEKEIVFIRQLTQKSEQLFRDLGYTTLNLTDCVNPHSIGDNQIFMILPNEEGNGTLYPTNIEKVEEDKTFLDVYKHSAPSKHGHSGALLLIQVNGNWKLVAINHGGVKEERDRAYCTVLHDFIVKTRQ